jgi:hypothetical protein
MKGDQEIEVVRAAIGALASEVVQARLQLQAKGRLDPWFSGRGPSASETVQ